jgi:transcriptional antiterminator RfaH
MQNWYAVFTKPRQEQLAAEHLGRQGFETYLPRLRCKRRRRGGWVPVVEALFPRYLFVSVEAASQTVAPIRSTVGVTDLVRFGQELAPVPGLVIDRLRSHEDAETGLHELGRPLFRQGDKVTVVDGPFAGIDGVFQAEKGQDRVLILLSVLGGNQSVTMRRDSLAPAGA